MSGLKNETAHRSAAYKSAGMRRQKWVVELAALFLSPFFVAGLAICSLIAAIGEQIVDHGWIRQGRYVSQIVQFIGSNFAQNASHDLTRSSLG